MFVMCFYFMSSGFKFRFCRKYLTVKKFRLLNFGKWSILLLPLFQVVSVGTEAATAGSSTANSVAMNTSFNEGKPLSAQITC